jgi:hypothetical protein
MSIVVGSRDVIFPTSIVPSAKLRGVMISVPFEQGYSLKNNTNSSQLEQSARVAQPIIKIEM